MQKYFKKNQKRNFCEMVRVEKQTASSASASALTSTLAMVLLKYIHTPKNRKTRLNVQNKAQTMAGKNLIAVRFAIQHDGHIFFVSLVQIVHVGFMPTKTYIRPKFTTHIYIQWVWAWPFTKL